MRTGFAHEVHGGDGVGGAVGEGERADGGAADAHQHGRSAGGALGAGRPRRFGNKNT